MQLSKRCVKTNSSLVQGEQTGARVVQVAMFSTHLSAHLEVYHHRKYKDGGDEVHEVRQVLPVEGLSEGTDFISASGQ